MPGDMTIAAGYPGEAGTAGRDGWGFRSIGKGMFIGKREKILRRFDGFSVGAEGQKYTDNNSTAVISAGDEVNR